MLAMGWSVRRTVLILYAVTAILSAARPGDCRRPCAMKRVLLVQPSMQPPGGGNGVAAWVLQALVAEHHRVTVLSWRPVEIDPINRFFGTHLRPSDFDTIVVPARGGSSPIICRCRRR